VAKGMLFQFKMIANLMYISVYLKGYWTARERKSGLAYAD
jgi:hypothetical protein